MFLRPRSVVGLVGIQPTDEEQYRPPLCRLLALREAKVCLDADVAIASGHIDVCERDLKRKTPRIE